MAWCPVPGAAIMGGAGPRDDAQRRWGIVRARRVGRIVGSALLTLGVTLSAAGAALAEGAPDASGAPSLTLVTLQGPGTPAGTRDRADLVARQDAVLAAIGADEPVYRWTTALNGFALPLTDAQRAALDDQPGVAVIETDEVRPLAGRTSLATARGGTSSPRLRGGAGVVIGVVDSGIAPDSPAFADVPGLGRAPRARAGRSRTAPARSWAPAGSSRASARTGSGRRSRCQRSTTSGTARRSRRSRPATPA